MKSYMEISDALEKIRVAIKHSSLNDDEYTQLAWELSLTQNTTFDTMSERAELRQRMLGSH